MRAPHPLVVIQHISTIWTKASRGGINAGTRTQTPEVLELPALAFPLLESGVLVHEVVYAERDRFQYPGEKLEQLERTDPFRYDCLKLELSQSVLSVALEWERNQGVPRRPNYPKRGWSLQEDQWGSVIYNLRLPFGEGMWSYEKHCLSIGWFHAYSPHLFLEAEPAHRYRDLAQLR